MKNETHVCDYCQDPKNPVTQANGGEIVDPANQLTIARVHKACREAWEKRESLRRHQSVSTFEKLK
ncbi:MAG TPA: hypothetical protein VJN93_05120 [Candidatus Acidoferrum sp.]|nr:hypothetical protein [Candidatus Acidoferrum sp.]